MVHLGIWKEEENQANNTNCNIFKVRDHGIVAVLSITGTKLIPMLIIMRIFGE
jgi:hypothetical protein